MHPVAHKLADPLVALALGLFALGLAVTPAQAQRGSTVPSGYEPPRGMCRIWIEGVPAAQQPAPTDCATAIRKRPSNAAVIFGQPVRSLEEADRVREQQLPTREYWSGRDRNARAPTSGDEPRPSASRDRDPDNTRDRTPARNRQPTQAQPAPKADPERSRQAPQPTPRVERTPPPASQGRSRVPPVELQEDLLARELWLDHELLASLYGESPPGGMRAGGWPDNGRAAASRTTGERGLSVYGSGGGMDALVPWAWSVDGRSLTASEVEARVRGELAMLGGSYGYGSGYGSGYASEYGYGSGYGGAYGGYAPYPGLVTDPSLLEPRPGECMDRNFDGRCDDLMGGADGCPDYNGDGRCDDARYDRPGGYATQAGGAGPGEVCPPGVRCDPYRIRRAREMAAAPNARPDDRRDIDAGYSAAFCFDRNRDGRCDEPWTTGNRIPQTLPEMASAVALRQGVPSYDVERWLRRSDLQARVTDRDGDGLPERVTWIDGAGQIAQIWTDRDGDGIADRVELFSNGLPVQVINR